MRLLVTESEILLRSDEICRQKIVKENANADGCLTTSEVASLLDIVDGKGKDYDKLLLEQHGNICWLHFAVRPNENRRRISFIHA